VVAPNGTVVCTDEQTFRVYARPAQERLFDYEVTLKALDQELVLGDTKEVRWPSASPEACNCRSG